MHEASLIRSLIRRVEETARAARATRVTAVHVKLGALSHCSAAHFREHYEHESRGSIAAGAVLHVIEDPSTDSPSAQDIVLESVEIEDS